jgi:chitinase
VTEDVQIRRWHGQANNGAGITAASSALASAVKSQKNGSPNILFAMSGDVIVGVYAGAQIDNDGLASIIQQFAEREAGRQVDQTSGQVCASNSTSPEILGIFVDTTGSMAAAKSALGGWNNATCLDSGGDETDTWKAVTIARVPGTAIAVGPADGGDAGIGDSDEHDDSSKLLKRATCKYTQAVSGDGCYSISQRCGITQAQLLSYNNDTNLCSDVKVGQYLCCSSGSLPDFTPQPNSDGSCKTYTFKAGDYCSAIATANTMTVADIEARNKNTWGWISCNATIYTGTIICLSTGTPPMPGSVSNALCGPTVPNTSKPSNMSTLASLNPCPLNVCCDIWGQCGITSIFCESSPAPNGAPGTSTNPAKLCVNSCNMVITNNSTKPSSFKTIGYWEAFNGQRPCLHMKVRMRSHLETPSATPLPHEGNKFRLTDDTFFTIGEPN